jgi:hypothetical protein
MKAKSTTSYRLLILGAAVLVLTVSVGCAANKQAPAPEPAPAPVQPDYIEHLVQYYGESLGVISQWYTGKLQNWTLVREANPGLRADRIEIGQVIRIPRRLLVREEPLPASFVKRVNAQYKKGGTAKPGEPSAAVEKVPAEVPVAPGPPLANAEPPAKPVVKGSQTRPAPHAAALPPADKAEDTAQRSAQPAKPRDREKPQPVAAAPAAGKSQPTGGSEDAERERLLDELLQ